MVVVVVVAVEDMAVAVEVEAVVEDMEVVAVVVEKEAVVDTVVAMESLVVILKLVGVEDMAAEENVINPFYFEHVGFY